MAIYETHELHSKEALRTHWYQGTYQDVKNGVVKLAKEFGYDIIDINDRFQEMLLEGPAVLVIKVTSYNRYEQGIDFNVTTGGFIDFGKGKKIITKWYEALGRYCKFKGVSLHP